MVTAVHVIEGTEFERGWGCRPDGFVAFTTRRAADEWITDYNKKYNNKTSAPDEYTTYDYVGLKECSKAFLEEVEEKGCKHFQRTKDLLM